MNIIHKRENQSNIDKSNKYDRNIIYEYNINRMLISQIINLKKHRSPNKIKNKKHTEF